MSHLPSGMSNDENSLFRFSTVSGPARWPLRGETRGDWTIFICKAE